MVIKKIFGTGTLYHNGGFKKPPWKNIGTIVSNEEIHGFHVVQSHFFSGYNSLTKFEGILPRTDQRICSGQQMSIQTHTNTKNKQSFCWPANSVCEVAPK